MSKIKEKKKIAVVVSVPFVVRSFLIRHLEILSLSYDVSLILNNKGLDDNFDYLPQEINIINVPISRKINLISDLYVLIFLFFLFKKNEYTLVYSITPKAGLLAMIASYLSNVPNRIHTFTGQIWSNRKGFIRLLLMNLDRVISKSSTVIIIDSVSQQEFLIKHKIIDKKSIVIGDGSISGVDLNRFSPNLKNRITIRKKLGISEDSVVFLYMGRLNKEKGIVELCNAFKKLLQSNLNVYLLIVGPDEDNMRINIRSILNDDQAYYKFLPYTITPEIYFHMSDILCLPSYREGFGSVVIEAAACGIPCIGSDIYGLSDAIQDRETGLLVEAGRVDKLFIAMKDMAENHKTRLLMGSNAKNRVVEKFSQDLVTQRFIAIINNLLKG